MASQLRPPWRSSTAKRCVAARHGWVGERAETGPLLRLLNDARRRISRHVVEFRALQTRFQFPAQLRHDVFLRETLSLFSSLSSKYAEDL